MKCITLTLNPAFDKHCFVDELKIGYEHLAERDFCCAGGKGVNISRALKAGGIASRAVIVLGSEGKAAFCRDLDADGVDWTAVEVSGRIRENLTVHSAGGIETRISFRGFCASDELLDRVYGTIEPELGPDTVLTFTGSVTAGISMGAVNAFLKKASLTGARLVIDSKSFKTLDEITDLKPWLIKPNGEEISAYLGRRIGAHSEILEIARAVHRRGVENVMVSLGQKGAMLVCPEGEYICTPPEISVKSTVGAGDSSIAGFIAARFADRPASEALKTSVAYGTAACLREGTQPPRACDIEKILSGLCVEKLD